MKNLEIEPVLPDLSDSNFQIIYSGIQIFRFTMARVLVRPILPLSMIFMPILSLIKPFQDQVTAVVFLILIYWQIKIISFIPLEIPWPDIPIIPIINYFTVVMISASIIQTRKMVRPPVNQPVFLILLLPIRPQIN